LRLQVVDLIASDQQKKRQVAITENVVEMAVLTVTRLGAANTKVAVGFMIGVCTMVTHHMPSLEA